MRRAIFIIFIFLSFPQLCFSYGKKDKEAEKGTHYALTANAIKQSNIEDYLNDHLNIKLSDMFNGPVEKPLKAGEPQTVSNWIAYGGDWEDVGDDRCLNHFYDPTTGKGGPVGHSALERKGTLLTLLT